MSGKGGGKKKRDPADFNPAEKGRIAQYYRLRKRVPGQRREEGEGGAGSSTDRNMDQGGETDFSGDEGAIGGALDDYEMGGDVVDGGRGMGGGGGAGNSGPMGVQEPSDRPFGSKSRTRSQTYTKSFTSYITNGIAEMNWQQVAGTQNADPYVTWNEGWQLMAGYGTFQAAMTPNDWYQLTIKATRIRVKSCSVLMEGLIPFQETVNAAGDRVTQATASNRPTVWYFIDEHKNMLPKLVAGTSTIHNNTFQSPYGDFTESRLPTPSFRLRNVDTAQMPLRVVPMPQADHPQALFSLLSTGEVKSLNAGQKLSHSWTNPVKQWYSMRLNWDEQQNFTTVGVTTPAERMQAKNNALTAAFDSGISHQVGPNANLKNYNFPQTGVGQDTEYVHHYADTGFATGEAGPPYILCKVEPYFDTANNAANIYMQCHVHYSITIEYEEPMRMNTLAWYNQPNDVNSGTIADFAHACKRLVATAAQDNEQHLIYGPSSRNQKMYV